MDLVENLDISNKINNNFINSTFGKIINSAIENGIKALFPDNIENNIINIKNDVINKDFSSLLNNVIDTAINFGKNKIEYFSEKFESVEQFSKILKDGNLMEGISTLIDNTVDKATNKGLIKENIGQTIKDGKNMIFEKIENNINSELNNQEKNIKKLEKYNKKWNEAFENKDFTTMEKNIKKIDKLKNELLPIKNIIDEAENIVNIHELIKNNGNNFEISEEALNLAKSLK